MKKKKLIVWSLCIVLAYLVVGHFLHQVVFPLKPAPSSTYPRTGDKFGSHVEGVHQHVTGVQDGWVKLELVMEPGAQGPPVHFHRGFDERFTVAAGTLSMRIEDRVVTVGPGESVHIPAGVPHQPFNPGAERVVVSSDTPVMPQAFAACLVQLYGVLDHRGASPFELALQASVLDETCDTHLAEVPGPITAMTRIMLAPSARLLGYRNFYPEYALHAVEDS